MSDKKMNNVIEYMLVSQLETIDALKSIDTKVSFLIFRILSFSFKKIIFIFEIDQHDAK